MTGRLLFTFVPGFDSSCIPHSAFCIVRLHSLLVHPRRHFRDDAAAPRISSGARVSPACQPRGRQAQQVADLLLDISVLYPAANHRRARHVVSVACSAGPPRYFQSYRLGQFRPLVSFPHPLCAPLSSSLGSFSARAFYSLSCQSGRSFPLLLFQLSLVLFRLPPLSLRQVPHDPEEPGSEAARSCEVISRSTSRTTPS